MTAPDVPGSAPADDREIQLLAREGTVGDQQADG